MSSCQTPLGEEEGFKREMTDRPVRRRLAARHDRKSLEEHDANYVFDLSIPCYSLEGAPVLSHPKIYVHVPPCFLDPYSELNLEVSIPEAEVALTKLTAMEAYRTRIGELMDVERFKQRLEPYVASVLNRAYLFELKRLEISLKEYSYLER